jgi:predicted RNA-binding Zn-ribbon protein involved in translation (DUF1610 family)
MITELGVLGKQGEAAADFLKDLEEWGTTESPEEKNCGTCKRRLAGSAGYRFPCGHCFHRECLIDTVRPIVGEEEREIIDGRNRDMQAAEQVFASDCPLCGVLAVNRVRFPVLGITTPGLWSLQLTESEASPKIPIGRRASWFSRDSKV